MKPVFIAAASLLLAASSAFAADEAPTLEFHFAGKTPPDSAKAAILQKALDLLKSADFNTVKHANILNQSVPTIQDHYRTTLQGDYILIRYAKPATITTIGGDVVVYDLVICLARPDLASAVFTIDDTGRVVAHEKYSGGLAIELKQATSK